MRAVAALALVTLTLVNVVGVRAGKRTNNTLMVAKVGGILALLALVFTHGSRAREPPRPRDGATCGGRSSLSLLFTALVPILFAYGGWQSCGSLAAEIKDPARNLARANIIGVIVVIVLYLSLNLAYLWAFTPREIANSPALAADVARRVAGEAGARFVALLVVISSLGFLGVVIITGPRLYYAMARDGLFLARAGRLHSRYHTPVFALWFQAGVSLVLLTTNTYDELLSYTVFADWLFFGLTAGALFILRRREPAAVSTARAPGHPVHDRRVHPGGRGHRLEQLRGLSGAIVDWHRHPAARRREATPSFTGRLQHEDTGTRVYRLVEGDARCGGEPGAQRHRLLSALAAAGCGLQTS